MTNRSSNEWKKKIGNALRKPYFYTCDNCSKQCVTILSDFRRKKRHFCSRKCYSLFRRDKLPIEEHAKYGKGLPIEQKVLRYKARIILNHAVRAGKILRKPCELCGKKAEAHHDNYYKPLEVRWFCFKHHRKHHKENGDLLNDKG